MDYLSVFNPSRLLISSLNSLLFFICSLFLLLLLSLLFSYLYQIWPYERLQLFQSMTWRPSEVGSNSWEMLQKSNQKKERLTNHLDMPQILLSTLYDSHVLFYEFNKGLECSKSPMETVYYLLIWAKREPSIYYLYLLSFFFFFSFSFLFFFPCHVIFPMTSF